MRIIVGLRFGVPGLPCLSTAFCGDGTAVVGGVGVLLAKPSNETSVPLAFLIVSLEAARGTNARKPTSSQLADMEGVDGVGGGDDKPRLFEECARVEGWWGGWAGEAIV